MDFKDQKALHVFGKKKDTIIAYTRVFKSGDYFDKASIGRVVISNINRRSGLGHDIMKASIETIKTYFNEEEITISAQKYLKKFYESHGFTQTGVEYLEDGIPHIRMDRN